MKKILFLVILFFTITLKLWAQDNLDTISRADSSYWITDGRVYMYMTQGAQFNWAKGGDNIFSALTKTQFQAKYKKDKSIWDNLLKWNYGFLFVGVPEDHSIDYRTSDDYFELNSSYGYKAKGDFYYNMLFNFKTQFLPGYKYPNDSVKVSNFLSPAYIIFSLGVNYKPNENFKLMVSPLTSKTTLVVRESEVDETKFGLKKGERIYKEIGAYVTLSYKFMVIDEIALENELTLFSNYEVNPENIDFELKTNLNFKITKNIKSLISFHFIYDDDALIPVNSYENGVYKQIGYTKGLQFQEKIMVGIGLDF